MGELDFKKPDGCAAVGDIGVVEPIHTLGHTDGEPERVRNYYNPLDKDHYCAETMAYSAVCAEQIIGPITETGHIGTNRERARMQLARLIVPHCANCPNNPNNGHAGLQEPESA